MSITYCIVTSWAHKLSHDQSSVWHHVLLLATPIHQENDYLVISDFKIHFQSKDHTLRGHGDSVDQLCWHPRSADLLATASGDKTVRLWDARAAKSVATITTKGMRVLVYLVGYLPVYKDCLITFDSLWPSDAIWCWGSWSTLVQVMACCLMASSHYLNQCWLIIGEVFWYLLEDNFTGNAQHIYLIFHMSLKIPNVMLQLHLPVDSELVFLFPAKCERRNA